MKTVIILFIALIFSAPITRADSSAPQRWEYATLSVAYRDVLNTPYSWRAGRIIISGVTELQMIQVLKKLDKEPSERDFFLFDVIGEAGWELVGVSNTPSGATYIFKRARKS